MPGPGSATFRTGPVHAARDGHRVGALLRPPSPRFVYGPPLDFVSFFVPLAARWEPLRTVVPNVGEDLNRATAALEEANPRWKGCYNDERKLGDVRK